MYIYLHKLCIINRQILSYRSKTDEKLIFQIFALIDDNLEENHRAKLDN